ncbi:MAG: ribosome maturation factor RimM [Zoogloeaceae bacterium]|nr:ribosome maturation factor RimM [Zoogloeaceae bacterium]
MPDVALPPDSAEWVILGRVAGPYGLQGFVRVQPFGDDPLDWQAMSEWWLAPTETGAWRPLTLEKFRAHGEGFVASFADITDRNAADRLKGWYIGVPRASLPPPAENEFYWDDLMGLLVENEAGEALGTVHGLMETGANDVLRVVDASGVERLLPFVDAVVKTVDLPKRRITVAWGLDW